MRNGWPAPPLLRNSRPRSKSPPFQPLREGAPPPKLFHIETALRRPPTASKCRAVLQLFTPQTRLKNVVVKPTEGTNSSGHPSRVSAATGAGRKQAEAQPRPRSPIMGQLDKGVYFIPALNAAACALLSSYTLISILDHERWMKVNVRYPTGRPGGLAVITTKQGFISTFDDIFASVARDLISWTHASPIMRCSCFPISYGVASGAVLLP